MRLVGARFQTFLRNAIKDDGGIPGFEVLADNILILSESSESRALFRASNVSFVAEVTCINNPQKLGNTGMVTIKVDLRNNVEDYITQHKHNKLKETITNTKEDLQTQLFFNDNDIQAHASQSKMSYYNLK